jgi:class 3 adenylate cyclase
MAADRATDALLVEPTAERRLVSVLFADLVGFTAYSEGRDAEDVRELQSRYFESVSEIIARYGGTSRSSS